MELLIALLVLKTVFGLVFIDLPALLDWWDERRTKSPAELRHIAIEQAERGYLWGPPPSKDRDIMF